MSNEYYNPSGSPSTGAAGSSAVMRSEFSAIQAAFALMPTLSGNGSLPLFVNAGATALEAVSASTARLRLALGTIATQDANNVAITGGSVTAAPLTSNNAQITAGRITASPLISNNVSITGGTISGVSQLASNNVTITGGTITGVSQLGSNNVAITGGTISGLDTITVNNVTASGNVSAATVIGNVVATQANMESASAVNLVVTPGRQQFHPSAAKAWGQADFSGGVTSSYNVGSVTDVGTGLIVFTWSTAFSSNNYCTLASVKVNFGAAAASTFAVGVDSTAYANNAVHLTCARVSDGALQDPNHWMIESHGDQ